MAQHLYRTQAGRLVTLFALFLVFEALNYGIGARLIELPLRIWAMAALAGSFAGRAIAYMPIGAPFRMYLTKTVSHSAGVGETTEPAYTGGVLCAIGQLITCPVCAGTWSAGLLLLAYAYAPEIGRGLLYTLSAAAAANVATNVTELAEWGKHGLWEATGHMNRRNRVARMKSSPRTTIPAWMTEPAEERELSQ